MQYWSHPFQNQVKRSLMFSTHILGVFLYFVFFVFWPEALRVDWNYVRSFFWILLRSGVPVVEKNGRQGAFSQGKTTENAGI